MVQLVIFWTQYLAVAFVFIYILYNSLLGCAFRRNILESRVHSEIKHSLRMPGESKGKYDF